MNCAICRLKNWLTSEKVRQKADNFSLWVTCVSSICHLFFADENFVVFYQFLLKQFVWLIFSIIHTYRDLHIPPHVTHLAIIFSIIIIFRYFPVQFFSSIKRRPAVQTAKCESTRKRLHWQRGEKWCNKQESLMMIATLLNRPRKWSHFGFFLVSLLTTH